MLELYRPLSCLSAPALKLYLRRRAGRGKEDFFRMGERRGSSSVPRPHGPLLWVHAASVGEAMSSLPLITRLLAQNAGLTVLQTTGTTASAVLMAERLPARTIHQFVPADHPAWVRRFLAHWRPDAALWLESELWPNLVLETRRKGIPMCLVNARLSDTSLRRWRRFHRAAGRLLGCFDLVLAQTKADAQKYRLLGAKKAHYVGNLKQAASPLPVDGDGLEHVRSMIGARPLWLMASTHPEEETLAVRMHQKLMEQFPNLLTIILPRHPERGTEIARDIQRAGLTVAQRSVKEPLGTRTDIYLADTLGETGLFYRLADIIVIGGSFCGKRGGHNPLEPAHLDCAILFGPDMENFITIACDMSEAGAARQVPDEATLLTELENLLSDPDEVATCQRTALTFVQQKGEVVLTRIMTELAPYLPQSREKRT